MWITPLQPNWTQWVLLPNGTDQYLRGESLSVTLWWLNTTENIPIWSNPARLWIWRHSFKVKYIVHEWVNIWMKSDFFKPSFTWMRSSLILVPCWRIWLLSSFSSFFTNSAAALFFWVRRAAQIALYSNVLSSVGFPEGLFITPTRTPPPFFCANTNTAVPEFKQIPQSESHTDGVNYF